MRLALDVAFYGCWILATLFALGRIAGRNPPPAWGRWLAAAAAPLLLLKAYALIHNGEIFVDFGAFWRGGADVLAGRDPYAGLERPEGMTFLNPPTALPLFAGLAVLPLAWSEWAWVVLNLVGMLGIVEGSRRALNARAADPADAIPPAATAGLMAALALSNGARVGLLVGQLHVLTAVALVLALWAQGRGRAVAAGCALAVATVKPQTMVPFLLLFGRRADRPTLLAFAVGVVLLCLAATPPGQLALRVREMLARIEYQSTGGRFNDYSFAGNYHANIIGLEHALFGLGLRDRRVIRLAQVGVLAVLGALLARDVAWRPRVSRPAACALVACFSMLFFYHRIYDGIILALPLAYATARARSTRGPTRALFGSAAVAILGVLNVFYQVQMKVTAWSRASGIAAGLVRALVVPYATWAALAALVLLWLAARRERLTPGAGPPSHGMRT